MTPIPIPIRRDIELTRGDTWSLLPADFDLSRALPAGLTLLVPGAVLRSTIKRHIDNPDPGLSQVSSATGGVSITGPYTAQVLHHRNVTAIFPPSSLVYDVAVDVPGDRTYPLVYGAIKCLADVGEGTAFPAVQAVVEGQLPAPTVVAAGASLLLGQSTATLPLPTLTATGVLTTFDPLSIAGMRLWLDAAVGVFNESTFVTPCVDNTRCGGWQDQSGNARHATQSGADSLSATWRSSVAAFNNKPVCRFDGSNDRFSLPLAALDATAYTVAIVRSHDAADSNLRFALGADKNGGQDCRVYIGNEGTAVYARSGYNMSDSTDVEGSTVAASQAYVQIVRMSGSVIQSWVNGGAPDSGTSFNEAATSLRLGAFGSADTAFMDGDIAEVLIYGAISDDSVAALGNWLAAKYGISTSAFTFDALDPAVDGAANAAGNGTWCWFGNPRAVHFAGAHDRTYWSTVGTDGSILIHQYDHDTAALSVFNLHPQLEVDDHDNAGLLIRASDQRVIAYYAKHDAEPRFYYRVSTNPEDISAWGAEVQVPIAGGTVTYPSPHQMTDETNDPIYVFFRFGPTGGAGNRIRSYVKSTDGGATWGARVDVFDNGGVAGPYTQLASDGRYIHWSITDRHPGDFYSLGLACSLRHFYFDAVNQTYHKSDGTQIVAALPFASADVSLVYDGSTIPAWCYDIVIDGLGRPRMAFAVFHSARTDHRYRYARWNGSAWVHAEICTAGSGLIQSQTNTWLYSGGVAIDQNDHSRVYACRQTSAANVVGVGQHNLWTFTSPDEGATWNAGTKLTTDVRNKNMRPYAPINAHADLAVIWMRGRYTSYLDWNMASAGYPVDF